MIPVVEPKHLNGVAALIAAEGTALKKLPNEMDTAFVKRIVCAYLNATIGMGVEPVHLPR